MVTQSHDTMAVFLPTVMAPQAQSIDETMAIQVLRSTETPRVQLLEEVVDMPVVVQRQMTMIRTVLQTVEVQQLQFIDQVIELLVLTHRQILMVRMMQKTTEMPQLQHSEKEVDVPVEQATQAQNQFVDRSSERSLIRSRPSRRSRRLLR